MRFLMMTAAPRILLGITGLLALLLGWSNLQLVLMLGFDPQTIFLTVFNGLLAFICLYAALGRTVIFTNKE